MFPKIAAFFEKNAFKTLETKKAHAFTAPGLHPGSDRPAIPYFYLGACFSEVILEVFTLFQILEIYSGNSW